MRTRWIGFYRNTTSPPSENSRELNSSHFRSGWKNMTEHGLIECRNANLAPGLDALATDRLRIAEYWLKNSPEQARQDWNEAAGREYRAISESGVIDRALSSADHSLLDRIISVLEKQVAPSPGPLLATMLFCRAYEMPAFFPLENLSPWIAPYYLEFMQRHPRLFREPGDAGRYVEVITTWTAYLDQAIAANPNNPGWQSIADSVARNARYHMAYFTQENLKPLMSLRARNIERALKMRGCALDWQFAPRPDVKRIRLGILATNFKPSSETFATLPVYRHVDRSLFETVLISADPIEHP